MKNFTESILKYQSGTRKSDEINLLLDKRWGIKNMIEVKKLEDSYSVCNSCGAEGNLTTILVKYKNGAGGIRVCLCKKCADELAEALKDIKSTFT